MTERRTQEERSSATRARLLDATLELLVEAGYARTTTQAVAARAGLSRGAQLHHFPTRADLVVSAVRHLGAKQRDEVTASIAAGAHGLEHLAAFFDGPLFLASLELIVAARTDPGLRAAVLPFEVQVVRDTRRLARGLLGLAADDPAGRDLVDLTLDLLRGLGVAALLGDVAETQRRRERLLAAWDRQLTKESG